MNYATEQGEERGEARGMKMGIQKGMKQERENTLKLVAKMLSLIHILFTLR